MDNIHKVLENIGLNERERKIYLTSLSFGQSPSSILGARNGLNRSTAQYICNSLVDKKLLSRITKGNTTLYTPEDPEKLLSILNKEYNVLEKKMIETRNIVSELKNMINPKSKIPKVKYYTGVEGIIEMFEDVLLEKKDVYGFLQISNEINKEIFNYLNNKYSIKRSSLGINAYSIFNINDLSLEIYKKSKNINRKVLLIPYELYPIECCIQIYGNKVGFYSYKNNDLTGVIIDNENIAKTQKTLFDGIWNLAKTLDENKLNQSSQK